MPRSYICMRCGRTYSLQEYGEDRFCRSCGTYLMISRLGKEESAPAAETMAVGSEGGWRARVKEGARQFRTGSLSHVTRAPII